LGAIGYSTRTCRYSYNIEAKAKTAVRKGCFLVTARKMFGKQLKDNIIKWEPFVNIQIRLGKAQAGLSVSSVPDPKQIPNSTIILLPLSPSPVESIVESGP
jgi:hypothetical protein